MDGSKKRKAFPKVLFRLTFFGEKGMKGDSEGLLNLLIIYSEILRIMSRAGCQVSKESPEQNVMIY